MYLVDHRRHDRYARLWHARRAHRPQEVSGFLRVAVRGGEHRGQSGLCAGYPFSPRPLRSSPLLHGASRLQRTHRHDPPDAGGVPSLARRLQAGDDRSKARRWNVQHRDDRGLHEEGQNHRSQGDHTHREPRNHALLRRTRARRGCLRDSWSRPGIPECGVQWGLQHDPRATPRRRTYPALATRRTDFRVHLRNDNTWVEESARA
mmetsp:Transcript_467/g.895  ORF Transcript_467/g.895 Transcript_467/m.895 type:complete len:205 (-) Transcript_467:128-742(-)